MNGVAVSCCDWFKGYLFHLMNSSLDRLISPDKNPCQKPLKPIACIHMRGDLAPDRPPTLNTKVSMENMEQRPLERALELWRSITGVKPGANGRTTIGAYKLVKAYEELIEAVELDPTDITATLLLSHQLNEYLAEQTVTLGRLLRDPSGTAALMKPISELNAFLNDEDLLDTRDRFISAVRSALTQYGVSGRDDVEKLFADHDMIAILRRDALRSIKTLRVDQFLDGSPEPAGIRPVYTKVVHQWWNVNSMLAALTAMPAGVSVNMIRHPGGYQSYFAFVIRNGGNLFVLTDMPEHAHPLASMMSRRPDRELQDRAARHWFPYDLLDVGYDEESGRLYMEATSERSLVAYQPAARPLKPIADLAPPVVVWLAMMFDLIVERFWKQGFKAPALSYTGEMLANESRLISAAQGANLPVPLYEPIGLPALTLADVHSSVVAANQVGKKYDNPNAWMEERYKDKVLPETLNLTGRPETVLYLQAGDGKVRDSGATAETEKSLSSWDKAKLEEGRTTLNLVNATAFGTRERVEADRMFIARSNYAVQINRFATEEYEKRKDEVEKWYWDRLKANADSLILWSGNKELWCGGHAGDTFGGSGYTGSHNAVRYKPISVDEKGHETGRVWFHNLISRAQVGENTWGMSRGRLLGEFERTRGAICMLNGTKATFFVTFAPTSAVELALLAGCKVEELPDVLQHWTLESQYRGNQILDRIDPLVWKAKNPWLKMDFRVSLAFSKRAMEKISKDPLVPPGLNLLVETGHE